MWTAGEDETGTTGEYEVGTAWKEEMIAAWEHEVGTAPWLAAIDLQNPFGGLPLP